MTTITRTKQSEEQKTDHFLRNNIQIMTDQEGDR